MVSAHSRSAEAAPPAESNRNSDRVAPVDHRHVSPAMHQEQVPGVTPRSNHPTDVANRENTMFANGFSFSQVNGGNNITDGKPQLTADNANGGQGASALPKDVVHITTTLPGSYKPGMDRQMNGSGFLVNTACDAKPSARGEQLIATADHVTQDNRGQEYKLGANLFQNKSVLDKKDLNTEGNKLVAATDPKRENILYPSQQEYAAQELKYIQQNFDDIKKVSQESSPGAKGITQEGLEEYRRRNTKIDVETQAGHFPATVAGRAEKGVDVAVLKLDKLTPEQQQQLGPNQTCATDVNLGDSVKSVGYKKTVDGTVEGVKTLQQLQDKNESIKTSPPLYPGMSGGPTFTANHELLGINHATSPNNGYVTPNDDLTPVLQGIADKDRLKKNR